MDIESIGVSNRGTVYRSDERSNQSNEIGFDNIAISAKDSYESSVEESYYATYTSDGTLVGEKVSAVESEEPAMIPERYWKAKRSFDCCYIYYQGERITEWELFEKAVTTGAITLDETETIAWNVSNARQALIDSKATPLYDWSTTLYSEDRKYVFRVENGIITGATSTEFSDGTTFFDVANEIASGTRLSDMDLWKLEALAWTDEELYNAAVAIGTAKSRYDNATSLYQNGELTKKQYLHDLYPVFLLLYGKDADIHSDSLLRDMEDFFSADDFLTRAFARYDPDNEKLIYDLLVNKNYHAYSGMY